jgi:hypothetical protein
MAIGGGLVMTVAHCERTDCVGQAFMREKSEYRQLSAVAKVISVAATAAARFSKGIEADS